jgi:hypothetical protein
VMFDNPTAALANGFVLVCSTANMAIYRCDASGSALLAQAGATLASGIYLWMRYLTDGTVEGWSSTDNVTWTRNVSVVDTSHLDRPLYIGIQQDDQTVFMDDFGGGGAKSAIVIPAQINSTSTVSGNVAGKKPIVPTGSSFTDNFNRANAGVGANWTASSDGGLLVVSGKVRGNGSSATDSYWTANTFNDDQFSQITALVNDLPTDYAGVTVRQQGTGGQAYYLGIYFWHSGSPLIQLYKHTVGGTYTQLGSSFSTGAIGIADTLRIEAIGSTITVKLNGMPVITQTDTSIPSGGSPGIQMNGFPTADDWIGGSLGVPSVFATSTVSATVTKTTAGGPKSIVAAQVNATSTVSGSVTKPGLKPLVTANISATSTVGGTVAVSHPTTPVLDDFNRANGDPGTNWNGPAVHTSKLTIVSNRISALTNAFSNECWVVNSFGPVSRGSPIEVFAQATTMDSSLNTCVAMFDKPTSPSASGYVLVCNNNAMALYRTDAGTSYQLLRVSSLSFANGTYFWMRYLSNGIVEGWASADNITWTRYIQLVDSTYLDTPLYIGVQMDATTLNMDNFGGGGALGVRPIAPLSLVSDNFNRANGGLGANWTANSDGGLVILSNKVKGNNASTQTSSYWTANGFSSDQFSQITNMVQNLGTDYAGVTVRQQGVGGQTYYVAVYLWNSGTPLIQLYKHVAGGPGYVQLGSNFSAAAAGPTDVLRLEANGSTLSVKWNGTAVITQTDTAIPSGGSPGIQIFQGATADDWQGGALGAPAILATSTVSGTVSELKRITPAQVSATSTVSGSVRTLRRVAPANISATSTVTGQVKTARGVLPTQISATSTVTGRVTALHRVIAAQISATSTVTGSVSTHPVKLISGGVVSATSTVSGILYRATPVRPTQILATSIVSGAIVPFRGLVIAPINATSTVSGRVVTRRAVSGQVAAISIVSGKIVRRVPIAGQINVLSTVIVFAGIRRAIFPSIMHATSTVSASLISAIAIQSTGTMHRLLSAGESSPPISSTANPRGSILSTVER